MKYESIYIGIYAYIGGAYKPALNTIIVFSIVLLIMFDRHAVEQLSLFSHLQSCKVIIHCSKQ
jgi:hypothetical protein